jgi:arylsulfatase A-like enzyme
MGEWKLILFFEEDRVELYHLEEDPGEQQDLAERDPRRAQRMRHRLEEWMEDVQAKRPTSNPDYVPWGRA